MKYTWILLIAITAGLVSCGEKEETEDSTEETSNVVPLTEEEEAFKKLTDLNSKMVKSDLSTDVVIAKELYTAGIAFSDTYTESDLKADALELAAKGAEGSGYPNRSVTILHDLFTNFPETDKTPNYMFNKGRILRDVMGNIPAGKAAYEELIARYPDHILSQDAKAQIETGIIEMSEVDLIKMIDSIEHANAAPAL